MGKVLLLFPISLEMNALSGPGYSSGLCNGDPVLGATMHRESYLQNMGFIVFFLFLPRLHHKKIIFSKCSNTTDFFKNSDAFQNKYILF